METEKKSKLTIKDHIKTGLNSLFIIIVIIIVFFVSAELAKANAAFEIGKIGLEMSGVVLGFAFVALSTIIIREDLVKSDPEGKALVYKNELAYSFTLNLRRVIESFILVIATSVVLIFTSYFSNVAIDKQTVLFVELSFFVLWLGIGIWYITQLLKDFEGRIKL